MLLRDTLGVNNPDSEPCNDGGASNTDLRVSEALNTFFKLSATTRQQFLIRCCVK